MEKNFQDDFYNEYFEIRKNYTKNELPKLLFHVCCGACSSYPLVFLSELFDITILYTNSNIFPKDEFEIRLQAIEKHVKNIEKTLKKPIKIVKDNYNYDEFKVDLEPLKDEREMGNRCKICIEKRMRRLFEYAKANGYEYVSSVMTISRNKDANFINFIGKKLMEEYPSIHFVSNNFKKDRGQEIGVDLAKIEGIYRQDYCGCEFSKR